MVLRSCALSGEAGGAEEEGLLVPWLIFQYDFLRDEVELLFLDGR